MLDLGDFVFFAAEPAFFSLDFVPRLTALEAGVVGFSSLLDGASASMDADGDLAFLAFELGGVFAALAAFAGGVFDCSFAGDFAFVFVGVFRSPSWGSFLLPAVVPATLSLPF